MASSTRNVGIFAAKEYPGPHRMRFSFAHAEEAKQWQRMCQAWVLAFLNQRGSIPFDPEYGTDFVPRLFAGLVNTEMDLADEFLFAKQDVFYYLTARGYFDRLGPAERLEDVRLRKWAYAHGHAELWLDFYDGTGAKIVVAWVPVAATEMAI